MKSIGGLGLLIALILTSASKADLVSKDFLAPGDGLLTWDASSNLEWLDLTPTLGYTYAQANEALGTAQYAGFRLATLSEFDHLLNRAGLQLTGSSSSSDLVQVAKTLSLQALLGVVVKPIVPGPSFPPIGTGHYSLGIFQSETPDTWGFGRVIAYEFNTGETRSDVTDYSINPLRFTDPAIGYFFVRDVATPAAVPEPATYGLSGAILLLGASLIRRRGLTKRVSR